MSASASSQSAPMCGKHGLKQPQLTEIDAGVSTGDKYSLVPDFQNAFWT
jgi:hypothetical protein